MVTRVIVQSNPLPLCGRSSHRLPDLLAAVQEAMALGIRNFAGEAPGSLVDR
jgi:hypothetical protein